MPELPPRGALLDQWGGAGPGIVDQFPQWPASWLTIGEVVGFWSDPPEMPSGYPAPPPGYRVVAEWSWGWRGEYHTTALVVQWSSFHTTALVVLVALCLHFLFESREGFRVVESRVLDFFCLPSTLLLALGRRLSRPLPAGRGGRAAQEARARAV